MIDNRTVLRKEDFLNGYAKKQLIQIGAILVVGLVAFGCKSTITNHTNDKPQVVPYHAEGWNVRRAANFHGVYVQANGYSECSACHGITTYGGSSGISCLNCHNLTILGCTGCHGGKDNTTGAPPYGLSHDSLPTDIAVGAHTAHVQGSVFSDGIPCQSCHRVPTLLADAGHLGEDSVADINFAGLSGTQAGWTRISTTCAGTYCHGNFTGGSPTNAPNWTAPGSVLCGSCHDAGLDPAKLGWKHQFHVAEGRLKCADCHYSVVDTAGHISGLSLHVNGVIDTLTRDTALCQVCHGPNGRAGCTGCHGGIDNQTGAPPLGLRDETLTSQRAVGAHTTHVKGKVVSDGINCRDCHTVPTSIAAPGHIGPDSIAELAFSPLAGAITDWNRTTNSCRDSYCHGNFTGGKPANAPVWTGTNQAQCGSCHDVSAPAASLAWKHDVHINVAGLKCLDCHYNVVDSNLAITGLPRHVNGVADTLTRNVAVCAVCHSSGASSCVTCHGGTNNQTGAPPRGLRGETATSQRAVGAHSVHLSGNLLSNGFACTECHVLPATIISTGHLGADSIAEITWGPFTGLATSWSRTTNRCSNSYCHGNFAGGKTTNTPVWTGTNQANCGTCHDVGTTPSLLGGRHSKHVSGENLACYQCHNATVNASKTIIGKAVHINHQNTVQFSAGGTYSGGTCSSIGCHGTKNWF